MPRPVDALVDSARDQLASGTVAYPLIVGLVALDALVPFVPAEVVLVTGALVATQGDLTLWLVFAAGVAGAMIVVYLLGDRVGEPAADRVLNGEESRRRRRWAKRKLRRHGEGLVVGSRFVPLGRTATSFAAGMLDFPWRRFVVADAVAALLSVGYLTAVGVVGGRTFSASFWPALAGSIVILAAVALSVEGGRRLLAAR
jgi:membrane protein DedA with SNARE-associated domain